MTTVQDNDGFRAWQNLCIQYEEGVEQLGARVMLELHSLGQRKAKNLAETKKMIIELESRAARVLQVRGTEAGDELLKLILMAALDEQTQKFTSQYQGPSTSYRDLKNEVLNFINRNLIPASQSNAMDIGRLEDDENGEGWSCGDGSGCGGFDGDDQLGALGKGSGVKCFGWRDGTPCERLPKQGEWQRDGERGKGRWRKERLGSRQWEEWMESGWRKSRLESGMG